MANLEIGRHLAEVGEIAINHIQQAPDNVLIFAEVEPGVVECSIFVDKGDQVVYRRCGEELFAKIYEVWEMEEESLRWTTMSYKIDGGRFNVDFGFEPPAPVDDFVGHRGRAVTARFGDKPVDFSDP